MASHSAQRPPSRASHASRVSEVSRGAASLYSVGSVHSVRSSAARSTVPLTGEIEPWKPPVLKKALFMSIPKASNITAIYSILQALFTMMTAVFDVYVLVEAEPGKEHFGYYVISFEFVYAGNPHVRNCLMAFAIFSLLFALALLIISIVLLQALRKENEKQIRPWLLIMFFHTCWRAFAIVFASLVNDMYFVYHGLMCFIWSSMILLNVYGWLVVWSFFNELTEVSKLEDIAHLKMGTMTSLNATQYSHTPSVSIQPGSRPITPHSYNGQSI
ncbi:uncharacterized protein LOC119108702 [Pollicipes pollicipes]|uniref:uncharacterized protein LOC119107668 n=1 Tax=Pollicipes pollicipes TaxID=41117 RepID=UPI0018853973|nr:uncharacterized protein LOC119107668 [Pollicipes pollicipes]XP_037088224.1 uncharacterized protein LOC119108702 [Pollicipes pollicipes]